MIKNINGNDWMSRVADRIEREHPSGPLSVASGISPSGPIHMGNLREVMTTHFVADELARRGREVTHVHSWDDFDRFRKVPAGVPGVDMRWEAYIGMPLTMVPAPDGSEHENWAEHFKAPFREALNILGVRIKEISQTEMYANGSYLDQVKIALDNRVNIGEIIVEHQTKGDKLDVNGYYPYKAYCANCHRDNTEMTEWDSENSMVSYHCNSCNHTETAPLSEVSGKLVWKVDWPMRWAYENIVFEPGGVDHMTPGSSWDVGRNIAPIFDYTRPMGERYSFVAFEGQAKMSSSKGGAPTPALILSILEPEMVRWLYARQKPSQAFSIDMGNTARLYDEWDALNRKVNEGRGKDLDESVLNRAFTTAYGDVSEDYHSVNEVKFSAWVSFADMTMCKIDRMMDLAAELGSDLNQDRAQKAINWVNTFMPNADRIHVSGDHREDYFNNLDDNARKAITMLADELEDYWKGNDLTRWSFGAAKASIGVDIDERNLTPEQKAFQKEYFKNVYQLLIGRDAGPRLPSLLRCIGLGRARYLLNGK